MRFLVFALLFFVPCIANDATDIHAFGVPYGIPIPASALKKILDEATDVIAVTGNVIVDTSASQSISSNPNLVLTDNGTGRGRFSPTGNMTIAGLKDMDGVGIEAANSKILMLLKGASLANLTINTAFLGLQVDNCIIRGINVKGVVRWNGSCNRFSHNTFDAGEGATAFKAGGGFAAETDWKSSIHNLIDHNTFLGGREEVCGFDDMSGGTVEGWGRVVTRHGNVVKVTVIGSDATMHSGHFTDSLRGPHSAVGTYVLILDGQAQGNYYEVIAQNGHLLTLDTSRFPVDGIHDGTYVSFGSSFVENEWAYNIVDQNAVTRPTYGETGTSAYYRVSPDVSVADCFHVGLSLFGRNYGNRIHHNTIIHPALRDNYSVGIADSSFAMKSNGGAGRVARWLYDWKLNSHNCYENNFISGFTDEVQAWTCMFTYAEWEGRPVSTLLDRFRAYDIEFRDNELTPGSLATMWNVKHGIWSDNTISLLHVNKGQVPSALASDVAGDTTFAVPPSLYYQTNMPR